MMIWNTGIRGIIFACLAALVVARSRSVETEFNDNVLLATETETITLNSNRRYSIHKVKVELYYMPQCPGCRQLISTSFSEAFSTPGFLDMADVTFVPYGTHEIHQSNMERTQDRRVFDNVLESCALDTIGRKYQQTQFDYIDCIDHSTETDASQVDRECATIIGLSVQQTRDIEVCATSHQGQALAERNVWQSKAIGATYFPWVVVDREHTSEIETLVWESLFDHVCEIYSGPLRSKQCPEREQGHDGSNTWSDESTDDEDFYSEQL